jgi:hypothetical protein
MAGNVPERSRHQLFRSFRQVLEQAVTWELLVRNPSDRIRNRRVKLDEDRERRIFDSWEDVAALSAELIPAYRALPVFLVGTGMRPEEALALEWRDIDKAAAVASVERVHSRGRTKVVPKSPTANAAGCPYGRRCLGARRASPAHRHEARLPRAPRGRLPQARDVQPALLDARAPRRRHRASRRLRLPAYVRELGHCRRGPALLPLADHGHVDHADRRDIRAPRPRFRGVLARPARCDALLDDESAKGRSNGARYPAVAVPRSD